jgi:hypothetical protein
MLSGVGGPLARTSPPSVASAQPHGRATQLAFCTKSLSTAPLRRDVLFARFPDVDCPNYHEQAGRSGEGTTLGSTRDPGKGIRSTWSTASDAVQGLSGTNAESDLQAAVSC